MPSLLSMADGQQNESIVCIQKDIFLLVIIILVVNYKTYKDVMPEIESLVFHIFNTL